MLGGTSDHCYEDCKLDLLELDEDLCYQARTSRSPGKDLVRESLQLREASDLKKKEKEARRLKKNSDREEAEAQAHLAPQMLAPQSRFPRPTAKPDQSRRYQPLPDAIFLKKKK